MCSLACEGCNTLSKKLAVRHVYLVGKVGLLVHNKLSTNIQYLVTLKSIIQDNTLQQVVLFFTLQFMEDHIKKLVKSTWNEGNMPNSQMFRIKDIIASANVSLSNTSNKLIK